MKFLLFQGMFKELEVQICKSLLGPSLPYRYLKCLEEHRTGVCGGGEVSVQF